MKPLALALLFLCSQAGAEMVQSQSAKEIKDMAVATLTLARGEKLTEAQLMQVVEFRGYVSATLDSTTNHESSKLMAKCLRVYGLGNLVLRVAQYVELSKGTPNEFAFGNVLLSLMFVCKKIDE